jgi:type II secretory pathway component PulF
MPTFEYKIVNKSGDEENRHSFFLSKDELLQSLSSNEFLLSCKEISSRARALSRNNLLSFTSQMASMVSNGVKIDESLEYIAESQNQADIKVLAGELLERIRAGTPFSDSLHESSISIPQYYISAIRGGEESNNLDKALVFLYQYIKDADQGSKKMMSALMYPIFVFCIAVIACTYMLLEVVPEMQKNYSVIGQQLPEMTLNIIALSGFLKEYGIFLVIFLFLLVIFVKLTFAGKYRVYYLLFIAKIPIIGKTLNLADNYNMLMTAGLLIKQGVAVDVSLNIAKAGLFFTQNKPKINDGIESIRSGQEMSNALFDANILDTTTVGIMRSGEISNIPGERMIDVAKIIKEKRDKMLEIITSLIGPISVVIVGIMILLIILGMLMPMFNLNDMEF